MPRVRLPSGTDMFYSIPTCTDPSRSLDNPTIDSSRPTLFFIHGASSDSRSWSEQILDPVMNQNFNLICVDLPFVGLTHTPKDWTPGAKPIPTPHEGKIMVARPFITQEEQAEDCAQLVMKLGLPPVHLVTDAINTGLAYPMMINHPELWKSSILLAPVTLAEPEYNKMQFAEVWRSFLEYEEEDAAEVMQGFYALFFGPRAGPEPERRAYWNRLWQIYLGTGESKSYVFGQWASCICLREPVSEELAREKFTMPICVASGTEHVTHPTAHAELENLLKNSPNCPFFESHHVGNAPSAMQITHPKEVNRIICKFVARCEGKPLSVYDPHVIGYNKDWDKPYEALEVRQQAAEKVGTAAPIPKARAKTGGLYSLVQSMRRPSTE